MRARNKSLVAVDVVAVSREFEMLQMTQALFNGRAPAHISNYSLYSRAKGGERNVSAYIKGNFEFMDDASVLV